MRVLVTYKVYALIKGFWKLWVGSIFAPTAQAREGLRFATPAQGTDFRLDVEAFGTVTVDDKHP